MKRIKIILICLFLCVLSLLGGTACSCSGDSISIVLEDMLTQDELFLNREFNVTDIIENYNEKYTYKIKECFYLDNLDDLKRYDLEVKENTKFTQTKPYDVHIVLEATHRKDSAEIEFVLKLVIPQNELQEHFRIAWNDTGVSKSVNGNTDYIIDGEESSLKVSYLGTMQPNTNNGVTLGSFVCDSNDASNTSWENAVITCQVYNPENFDLQLGYMATQNRRLYNNIGYMCEPVTLKAGEWTQVNWSLRKIGLNFNFIAEDISISFKIRIKDATGMQSPYQYAVYFCSMDIADYSPERFPNLETRSEEEIWNQMVGDLGDKYLFKHIVSDTTTISKFAPTNISAEVVTYDNSNISAPINNSSSYVKYDVRPTSQVSSGNYYAIPISFSTYTNRIALSDDYAELFSAENLKANDLCFEFWVYNDSDTPLSFRMSTADNRLYWGGGKSIAISQSKTWTKVKVSLQNDYGYTTSPFEEEDYDLMLFASYARGAEDTNWSSFVGTFFIDGFDFFNEEVQTVGDEISNLLNSSCAGDASKWFYMDLETSVVSGDSFGTTLPSESSGWLTKYDAKISSEKAASVQATSRLIGNIIHLPQNKLLQIESDLTILKTGYVGFWIYTDIVNTGNPTVQLNCSVGEHSAKFDNANYLVDGTWTYVEFYLGDFAEFITVDGEDTIIKTLNIAVEYSAASDKSIFEETLYITGFDIYEQAKVQKSTVAETLASKVNNSNNQWYVLNLDANVISKDAFVGTMPAGVSCEWLVKYVASNTSAKMPSNTFGAVATLSKNDLESISADGGYVGFWLYTEKQSETHTSIEIIVYKDSFDTKEGLFKQVVSSGVWTCVEFSLSDFVDASNLCIAIKYSGAPTTDFDETIYITDFNIYSQSKMQEKNVAEMLATKANNPNNQWYVLTLNTSVVSKEGFGKDMPSDCEGEWLVRYDATNTSAKTPSNTYGALLTLTQAELENISENKGYVGFWIYTEKQSVDHSSIKVLVYKDGFATNEGVYSQTINNNGWTYVEFELSDFITDNGNGSITIDDLHIAVRYAGTPTINFNETIYICGFNILTDSNK